MPENEIARIQEIYAFLEKLGINRADEGTRYVAFMVRRLANNQYETLHSLKTSTARNFSTTPEAVMDKVYELQIRVHKYLTEAGAQFNPMCKDIMKIAFSQNEYNIKNTEQFLKGIAKMVKG